MKDKLYLKTPYKEHKDLTVPVTVLKYPNSPTDEYIVYSPLIDNTFSIGIDNVKTTPVDSEYVVDAEGMLKNPKLQDRREKMWNKEKRLYIATAAMQGILSNQVFSVTEESSSKSYIEYLCKDAYRFADELLKQEKL